MMSKISFQENTTRINRCEVAAACRYPRTFAAPRRILARLRRQSNFDQSNDWRRGLGSRNLRRSFRTNRLRANQIRNSE